MLKLYKRVDGRLHYWETWEDSERSATVHWGLVGEDGDKRSLTAGKGETLQTCMAAAANDRRHEGYAEISGGNHAALLIEYAVDGMGDVCDVDKRHALEELMNEMLGWAGLGHCDGGSIGSGTMEVCCFVVDFDIARSLVASRLKDTDFADYVRIYCEVRDLH